MMFKKIFLALTLFISSTFFNLPPQAHARVTPRGLAITGVALGGTALALGAYNTYQNYRHRRNYHNNYYYYDDDYYYRPPTRYYSRPAYHQYDCCYYDEYDDYYY